MPIYGSYGPIVNTVNNTRLSNHDGGVGVWNPNQVIRWWVLPQTTTSNQTSAWDGVFGTRVGGDGRTMTAVETPVAPEPAKPKKDPFDPRNWGL